MEKYRPINIMLHNIRSNQNPNEISQITLKSLRVDIGIANHLASSTIDQEFFNIGPNPVECEYKFPVLKNSVVTALNILLPDGSVLSSHIEEEQKASETYQDALSQGHAAALGRSEDPDSMVIYVVNILPWQSVQIQIILASPVSVESNSWKFLVPSELVPSLSGANNQGYPIEAKIQIKSLGAISDFSCTWDLAWSLSEDKASLTGVISLGSPPEKPLSIMYKNLNTHIPTCIVQRKGDQYAAMISFIPLNTDGKNSECLEGTGEYIFILDRSGSMYGQRIQIATNAAVIFLKSLPLASKFNIISFGSASHKMFPVSQQASTEIIAQAISQLSVMNADMGGNDICSALKLAFQFEPENEYPRSLFLITDGGESDWRPSLSLIKENKSECRIYGFGIQASTCDAKFLSEAAELGKGSSFFVYDIQELGKNVVNALSKCVIPCMNKWEINWAGRAVPTSKNIGSVYYGETFTQYVLMDALPNSLPTIQYFDTYQQRDIGVNIYNSEIVEGDQLFKLWAKNEIAELSMDSKKNSKEIIKISKEYQVVSPLTAFICVKTQDGVVVGDLKTVKITPRPSIPVATPRLMLATPACKRVSIQSCSSGRGGKGLGKIGAKKRHRKVTRDNLQGITKPAIKRLARAGSVKQVSGLLYDETRNILQEFLNGVVKDATIYTEHARRKTLTAFDAVQALKSINPINLPRNLSSIPSSLPESRGNTKQKIPASKSMPLKKIPKSKSTPIKLAAISLPPIIPSRSTQESIARDNNAYLEIITKMKSEGYWDYKEVLPFFKELNKYRREISGMEDNVVATVYLLCYLAAKYSQQIDEWMLMKRKAVNWLAKAGIDFERCKALFVVA